MNTQFNPYVRQPFYSPPITSGIVWVQGIEGAKAYQLTPNSNMILLDSENDGVMYIKIADNVGMCTLRRFKYTETTETTPTAALDLDEYVRKDELKKLLEEMTKETNDEQSVPATRRRIFE